MIKNLIKIITYIYHIYFYINETTGLPKTDLCTKRNINYRFRFVFETKFIIKFPFRVPAGRKIPSGLPVPTDSLTDSDDEIYKII